MAGEGLGTIPEEEEVGGSEASDGDEHETRPQQPPKSAEIPDEEPSEDEKRLLYKIHVNMGHPDSRKFCR
eukprot:1699893-Pyramimonas_sp.AAC.1